MVIGVIKDLIMKGKNLTELEEGQGKKKGKSANEQNLFNLKNSDGKFKYLNE